MCEVRRDLNRNDYKNVYQNLKNDITYKEWFLDIGKFGEIGHPGVSDLDIAIVVRKGNLVNARRWFERWKCGSGVSFFFPHPPVFLTPSLLPHSIHLHTLSDLKWERSVVNLGEYSSLVTESGYLDLIWACFIIRHAIRPSLRQTQNLRDLLLVLKNVNMAEARLQRLTTENFCRYDNPLTISDKLREKVLTKEGNKNNYCLECIRSLEGGSYRLMRQMHTLSSNINVESEKVYPFIVPLGNGVFAYPGGDTTIFERHSVSLLGVPYNVWVLVFNPHYVKGELGAAGVKYWREVHSAKEIVENEDSKFHFIQPFGFPYYKSALYYCSFTAYRVIKNTVKFLGSKIQSNIFA
jgi:hypothetical protein